MRNKLASPENLLESRTMLAGTSVAGAPEADLPEPGIAETPSAAIDSETSEGEEGPGQASVEEEVLNAAPGLFDFAEGAPASTIESPLTVSLSPEFSLGLVDLFGESEASGLEEVAGFDGTGQPVELEVSEQTPVSFNFRGPSNLFAYVHTHPSEVEGQNAVPPLAPSFQDSTEIASQAADFGRVASLVQAEGTTFLLLAPEDALANSEAVAAATDARALESALELGRARTSQSAGGSTITDSEANRAENDARAAAANALGLVLYVGETGGQPDGSTLLERFDFEARSNLDPESDGIVRVAEVEGDKVFDADELLSQGVRDVIGGRGNDTLQFPSLDPEDLQIIASEGMIQQRNGTFIPAVSLIAVSDSGFDLFNLSSIETIETRGSVKINVQDALDRIRENDLDEISLDQLVGLPEQDQPEQDQPEQDQPEQPTAPAPADGPVATNNNRNASGDREDNIFNADELLSQGITNVIGRRGNDTLDFLSANPEDLLITATEGEIVQRNGQIIPAVRLLDFSGGEVQVFNLSGIETIRTRGSLEINVQDALDRISQNDLIEVNLADLV